MGTSENDSGTRFTPLPFDLLEAYKVSEVTSSAKSCRRVSLVSHNVMHASSENRLGMILQEYSRSMVIALQGTRRPQADSKPLHCFRRQGFLIYSGGYTKSAGEHSGVIIAFNLNLMSEKCLKYYHIPTLPLIQGRLVGVRRKHGGTDEFHMSVYFPPSTHPGASKIVQSIGK